MKPPPDKSILNPAWKYVPSSKQDCGALFKRIRKQLAEQQPKPANVLTIKRGG